MNFIYSQREGTRAASRVSGSSAADVDIPAFEECASKKEARMRESAGARGQGQG